MPLLSSVRRPRAASILPILVLLAACDDPSGTEAEDRPVALAAGGAHSCALTGAGTAFCWGSNTRGQLGNGTTTASAVPVRVDAPERLTAIDASHNQSCAVGASGAVYCWGAIVHVAPGTPASVPTPSRVESDVLFSAVSAGLGHACALGREGRAYCWGSDTNGELGDGPGGPARTPTPVAVSGAVDFSSIHAAALHSCALAESGTAYCWGYASFRVFGDGDASTEPAPVAAGAGLRFTSFDTGAAWACGVSGGDVHCWGLNRAGELGIPPSFGPSFTDAPNRVEGLPPVRDVFASRQNSVIGHVCALTEPGEAHCWGENESGEAGIEPNAAPSQSCLSGLLETTCVPEPVRAAAALRFRTLALGQNHSCGITRDHEIHCWGRAAEGQLGPAGVGGPAPVRVELPES